ncbi:sulfotransferase domain-containing protein [Aureimonas phyllosphaerae]|uniref:Alcohol sulfotransferase n=1 Tax=Aureimonas phyllosphaerae TaxID=1166078 RepID=A0A7W6BT69_9HYPH|nr:sulfotransferase domain-containing protein [Aureimonas phyllosphaerae]MBB3937553.1 alcohol sulfotransferase [Aureimonas phyllosphaerae]MBB3961647.1 alcohol sulfotransferase [Aureimonas phyllosphaerae]SFF46382.1 Sulfotransferase domain-containing protein [Aureimonas phyllosphaerae]
MTMLHQRAFRKIDRRVRMTWAAVGADTFLVSYPKSGRTWFRFILSHYFASLAREGEAVDLREMFGVVPNYDLDPVRGIPAFRYGHRRSDVPLILVTHHLYRRSLFLNRPIIFMVRDPRDVLVSAYFHATRHKHRFVGGIDEFIVDEAQGAPALVRYLNAWGRGLPHHRNIVISYEALTAETEATSSSVVDFLGFPHRPEPMRRAVEASRFEAMREREIEQGLPAHDYDRGDTESLRMRRGVAGGFADYLSEAQAVRILGICERHLTPAAKALVSKTGLQLG